MSDEFDRKVREEAQQSDAIPEGWIRLMGHELIREAPDPRADKPEEGKCGLTESEREEMHKLQEEMSMRELSGGHSIAAADLKRLMELESKARWNYSVQDFQEMEDRVASYRPEPSLAGGREGDEIDLAAIDTQIEIEQEREVTEWAAGIDWSGIDDDTRTLIIGNVRGFHGRKGADLPINRFITKLTDRITALRSRLAAVEKDNERYREALEFIRDCEMLTRCQPCQDMAFNTLNAAAAALGGEDEKE